MRLLRLVSLLLVGLMLGACGGSTTADVSPGITPAPNGLEAFPPPSQWKEAMAPNVSEGLGDLGSAGFINPSHNVTVDDEWAVFNPQPLEPGLDGWAYAAFPHHVDPALLAQADITVEPVWFVAQEPEDAYLGVANWTRDAWEFKQVDPAHPVTALLEGDTTIADITELGTGDMLYVLFAAGEGPCTLKALEFGNPPWEYWTHTWGTPDYDFIVDAACDGYGNMYLLGETTNYGAGDMDMMLMKVTPEGALDWAKLYGDATWEEAKGICCHADSLYVVGDTKPNGKDFVDILIQKWSLGGGLQASYTWGGDYEERAESILANESGVYVGGFTHEPTAQGYQDCDSILLKLDPALDAQLFAYTWGDRDWESVRTLCAPPDTAAQGRVCAGEAVNDGGHFTGDSKAVMSVWYDEGCAGRYHVHWSGYGSTEVNVSDPAPKVVPRVGLVL